MSTGAQPTKLPKYVYLPVRCPSCGWQGKRGNRVVWPACPKCGAYGNTLRFLDEGAAREPSADLAAAFNARYDATVTRLHAERIQVQADREARCDRAEELIKAGYRQLSKTRHPDVGGSDQDFAALKDTTDKLLTIINQARGGISVANI